MLCFVCKKALVFYVQNRYCVVVPILYRYLQFASKLATILKKERMLTLEGYSISFTLGKASSEHGGNIRHNNRDYFADNINKENTQNNVSYKCEDIEKEYHNLFDEALKEYNQKQSRPCRRISDYYEHIQKSKREETFYEAIIQFGNVKDTPCDSERGKIAKQLLDEYMKSFQKRNPNLHIFNAVLHMDEASPHLHIDFIPFYTKGRTNSLQKGVSMKAALDEQGFKAKGKRENRLVAWELSERKAMEAILNSHGLYREEKNAHHRHMTVNEYKQREAAEPMQVALKQMFAASKELLSTDAIQKLSMKIKSAENKISVLEKEKFSPMKSFFYSDPNKQSFIQEKMNEANIPYSEFENGFEAQECYVEQIRQWEKEFKSPIVNHRQQLRSDIDKLLMQCNDVNELYNKLQVEGYTIKLGKYISVKPKNAERFIRLKSLGEEYNEHALQNRIQFNLRFEKDLAQRIEKAKSENLPTYKTLHVMQFYTITFKKGVLPCRKKNNAKPLTWTNDAELDKLLLLNKKIGEGATIKSMKEEFTKLEQQLNDKNSALDDIQKKYQRLSKSKEAFDILFENKQSTIMTREQALLHQQRFPNINSENYRQVAAIADDAQKELNELRNEIKDTEKSMRELSSAISIIGQVQAGTYVQELVSQEYIRRNADIIPNGEFKL